MKLRGITDNMVAKIAQVLPQDPSIEEQMAAGSRNVEAEAKVIWEEMMDLADSRLQAVLAEDEAFGTELYKYFQEMYVKEHDTFTGIQ